MDRRTLIRSFVTLAAWAGVPGAQTWAQMLAFPGTRRDTFEALGALVLPGSLSSTERTRTLEEFVAWVRDYKEGAHLEHGYGTPRLRRAPASPAAKYLDQLAALETAAQQRGGAFASLEGAAKRAVVEAAIESAGVKELPGRPGGGHVATDLMALYFRGSGANDRVYEAAIGRGRCRTLTGSESAPAPLARGE